MTTRTTITITDEQWALIQELQAETGAPVSAIIRRALTHYFTQSPTPSPTSKRRLQYKKG